MTTDRQRRLERAAPWILSVALLVVFGLVPKKKKTSRLRRTILWLANVAGDVRVTPGKDGGGSGRSSSAGGGGGSSGGGGASGDY